MSDFETLARPYAKAVFELASEAKALAGWSEFLQLSAAVAQDAAMQEIIDMPSMEASDKAEVFLSVMASVEGAPEQTAELKNLMALLAENDRLAAIPDIADAFEVLKQSADGAIDVRVTTARKLTVKQQKDMASSLAKKLGKEVTITSEIDKSLIAGAIIHAGDLVIDGSARGKLNKLTTALIK